MPERSNGKGQRKKVYYAFLSIGKGKVSISAHLQAWALG
jgi:hypothetical protein